MELTPVINPYIPVLVALGLGMLIGLERTFAGKTAGLRTFGIVSMGAALFVVTAQLVLEDYIGVTTFDPLRIPSAIITGVGFLGAGLILFRENHIKGLTTAAGLWVACGVGIAAGFGYYILATFVTCLTLFVFTALWFVEQKLKSVSKPTEEMYIKNKKNSYDGDSE